MISMTIWSNHSQHTTPLRLDYMGYPKYTNLIFLLDLSSLSVAVQRTSLLLPTTESFEIT